MTTLNGKPHLVLRSAVFPAVMTVAMTAAGIWTDEWAFYGGAALTLACVGWALRALLPGRCRVVIDDNGVDLRFNIRNPGFFPWAQIDRADLARPAARNGRPSPRQVACLFVHDGGGLVAVQMYPATLGISDEKLCALINAAKPSSSSSSRR